MRGSNMIQVILVSILLIFAASLFASSAKESDFLVLDTFDADPTGTLPDGWIVRTGDEQDVKVVEEPSATNKSLEIDGGGGRVDLDRHFEPQTGVFAVEVDFVPVAAIGNICMPYIGKEGATNGGFSVCFLLFGKDISYHNGGWVRGTIGDAEEDKWYHVKIVVDVEAQSFDLYFDGEEIVKGAAFRGGADNLSVVDFGGGAETGYLYLIDNLMVYEGAERPSIQVRAFRKLATAWAEVKLR
jgi:hypothetical protein